MSNIQLEIFLEQAEYLDKSNFSNWSVEHPQEKAIIKKLISPGAKLITGPRGCGKTTLLLKSYEEALPSGTLPIYVNFKASLKLEPLYKKSANAAFWFNQWLIQKVLEGLYDSLQRISGIDNKEQKHVKQTIKLLESSSIEKIPEPNIHDMESLEALIERALESCHRNRCVLLLDDAAHAFSPEQQKDFFEFYRKIKSRTISPKAAIYPGVTSFSSSFHIGHDAEEIDVWINPETKSYYEFMSGVLERRLPHEIYKKLKSNENNLKLLCYAANGLPRALLNMINSIWSYDGETDSLSFDRNATLRAVKICFESTYKIYTSLKDKIPIYENFIEKGDIFFHRALTILKEFNKGSDYNKQTTVVAIRRPIEQEVNKVIGFFQYAGLMYPAGNSSRGAKSVYELYSVHNSAIIDRNVFFSKRTPNSSDYVLAFENRPSHHYPRMTTSFIFNENEVSNLFALALPPCQVCQTPRISESAKFCINCGAELTSFSVFEKIVNQDIDCLPLTQKRIDAIKKNSSIRKIKDILMDHERRELRKIPYIGPIWANKIVNYAEEFIA
ncbi:hypothetical protein NOX82_10075 [Pseudomonas citronellolis]|uniref:ORC-CDC6 family AAA ATPase n=1 Tax=Pseudomonas citronellolis TaxID=53408 RepID=UPI00211348CA|nr:hypothetical protein [Pseudomonas citronellolis]UUC52236.1 hypothetical protein NOX82_10075 [Pseudomonas citronellolis]